MNRRLYHRGPDSSNTMLFGQVALGFSRLSIIGLENGMQPIKNEDGSVVLVCNGEIFNYIELREELRQRGHYFTTDSDVEVILHLYEEQGMEFLNTLNGQFAFALYDLNRKMLFCVRDQMGIIPLYYTTAPGTFLFASEIKSLLAHPLVEKEVDLVGLDQVFSLPGLISPRTMFKNINSLENGHYLSVDEKGNSKNVEYWDLLFPEGPIPQNGYKEEYYTGRLSELFDRSVKLRLRADVPLGVYLSGGLDSSMIAMKVNQLLPKIRKQAFAIDFEDAEMSETPYQILVANASNSNLNKKTFLFRDVSERLRQAIYHSECPLKETYNTASLYLSELTRAKGIKVILSGEGSDELFAGYVGHRFDKMRNLNSRQNIITDEELRMRRKVWGDDFLFYETNFTDLVKMKSGLYSEELLASFNEFNCMNYPVVNRARLANRDPLNKRLYLDYKLRLVDHLVSDHGDRMAMANGVEVRYPFLDKDLVEFSTSVPTELKLNGFTEKYLVKAVAGRFVPDKVIDREKFHFVAPGSPYLLQNNIEYIDDLLSFARIKRQGYFNPVRIEQLKRLYKQDGFTLNVPFETDVLITVITFGILLDQFFS
jgi:asparagine synthase (glutamine-hydrolysing)